MITYDPPVHEYLLLLDKVFGIYDRTDLQGFAELDAATVGAVLHEASRLARDVMLPLAAAGDREGCKWDAGEVRTPTGFFEAYRSYQEGGWASLGVDIEFEGQGLPKVVSTAVAEFFGAANQGFDMYLGWGESGASILAKYGTDDLRKLYLPKLVSGEWSGSMALSEPQAGTDLALVRTKATPAADGSFRLQGSKIFNSGGDQDLTPNIVHFVLARVVGAASGSQGLSLFLAPKFHPDEMGGIGKKNRIYCSGIEHKMGLNASATCSMSYDDATAWMIGEPGQGLAIMFHLMNHMRRRIGAISVGVSELAFQNAQAYAISRLQGKVPYVPLPAGQAATPIFELPDVQRILSEIGAANQSARALLVWAAFLSDVGERSSDVDERLRANRLFGFLTPVLKGYLSDRAFRNCVLAQQLFGGYGYVTETGIDRLVRDTRILSVAEGVNAVQAMDLVSRHLKDMAVIDELATQIAGTIADAEAFPTFAAMANSLRSGLVDWLAASSEVHALQDNWRGRSAVAMDYLNLTGAVLLGWMSMRLAMADLPDEGGPDNSSSSNANRHARTEYFMSCMLPETAFRLARIRAAISLPSGTLRCAAAESVW